MSQTPSCLLHDGLIFDLDGTLWDSTAQVSEAFTRAARRSGVAPEKTFGKDDVAKIMGMSHEKVFATLFPELGREQREAIAPDCYKEEISTLREQGATLYPGVREGLVQLAAHYPLFIVSNCQVPYLETFLDWTGMRSLFQDSECYGREGKTKGENIREIARRHELKRAAYIGDTAGDQQASDWAGATYYHVTYGFGRPSRPCHAFASFAEVTAHFLSAH